MYSDILLEIKFLSAADFASAKACCKFEIAFA